MADLSLRDDELREIALSKATYFGFSGRSPGEIVACAEVFYAFLKGCSPPVAKAKGRKRG